MESLDPRWSPGEAWEVQGEPALTLGAPGGSEEAQLFMVRGAVRLDQGTIVVANSGSQQLLFFGPDGGLWNAVGGGGQGPGEFVAISRLWRIDDSLFVYDFQQGMRVSVFDLSGEFVRSFSLRPSPGGRIPVFEGAFRDRILVSVSIGAGNPPAGFGRRSFRFLLHDKEGQPDRDLGVFPGAEEYVATDGERVASIGRPFGLAPQWVVAGDRMYFGSSDTFEILVYTVDGGLGRVLRIQVPNRPVTGEDRTEFERWLAEAQPRMSPLLKGIYRETRLPEVKPAHGRLLVDAEENLWVARYPNWREEPNRWDVFDPLGLWLGEVRTPGGLRIFEIGSDYVLGLWRDDMNVERVQLHALRKR